METMFDATRTLWTEELEYWTGVVSRTGEQVTAETQKATKAAGEAWSALIERQTGMLIEYTQHVTAFTAKQVDLLKSATAER